MFGFKLTLAPHYVGIEGINNMTNDLNNWITEELTKNETAKTTYEEKPSMKFEESTVSKIIDHVVTVDFSQKFKEYTDEEGRTKAIIPIYHAGLAKNWWLNKKNPIYAEMLKAYSQKGQNQFKIRQEGNGKKTKYVLVE